MIPTKVPGFTLKPAAPEDTAHILTLVRELAEYENLSHEVTATEDTMREGLFGEDATAEAVLGHCDGDPVSLALYFPNFSTFLGKQGLYLEDLYVKPEFRGRGIGRAMMAYVAHLAQSRGCGRLEWAVLDWNETAHRLYRSVGAECVDAWRINRLTGDALTQLAEEF